MTSARSGRVWSIPPIVYGSVLMFVCGGASTWRSVCCGVVIVARKRRRRAGRHWAKLPRPTPKANPPPPGPDCWSPLPKPLPPLPEPFEPPLWPLAARAFAMQDWICANSAAVGGASCRSTLIRCPPAFSLATIFGTTPSWCSAISVNPDETPATPETEAICFVADWEKVSCVPGRKKSWTKCWPGLPSFDRSVRTERLESTSSRLPPNPPGPPPVSVWAARVTVRSVPMLESGFSAVFCAWSRPRESAEIAITSATPIERPSMVRIVLLLRRRSSLLRYPR